MSFFGIELPKAPGITYNNQPAKVVHIEFTPAHGKVYATIVTQTHDGTQRTFRLSADEVA